MAENFSNCNQMHEILVSNVLNAKEYTYFFLTPFLPLNSYKESNSPLNPSESSISVTICY